MLNSAKFNLDFDIFKYKKYRKENPLACRVLFYVLLFSSCITLAATAWQLYVNFKKDVQYIEKHVSQIKAGYGQGLSLGVWNLDDHQIYPLLNGILQLPDIQYLEIRGLDGEKVASVGILQERLTVSREFPLVFADMQSKKHYLGNFFIVASLESVYRRLRETVFQILVSQTIKTFLVSAFILLVIRHFITRHLSAIAQYVRQEKLGYLKEPINLKRVRNYREDELDQVVSSINRMRAGLLQYISERDSHEAELRRARDYINGIINSMPSVLVGIDDEGIVTQWNYESEKLTGIPRSDAIKQPASDLLPYLSMDKKIVKLLVSEQKSLTKPLIRVKKGNISRFFDVTIYPIAVDGMESAVIRMDDVTERVRIEETMIHNEKLLSVGALAAGVAHEINNPINSIINLAQIIYNDSKESSSGHDIATRIIKEGGRIARIVSSLLTFSRKGKDNKTPCAAHDILAETLSLTEAQMRKEEIDLLLDIPENIPIITVQKQQIQQVFLNIINNSQYALNRKFPKKDGEKRIKITCLSNVTGGKSFLRIIFFDNGIGIPKDIISNIFNPFFTTKPVGAGTGLGLSICQEIINNHNGRLRIESREGQFTRIVIDLPAEGKDT